TDARDAPLSSAGPRLLAAWPIGSSPPSTVAGRKASIPSSRFGLCRTDLHRPKTGRRGPVRFVTRGPIRKCGGGLLPLFEKTFHPNGPCGVLPTGPGLASCPPHLRRGSTFADFAWSSARTAAAA